MVIRLSPFDKLMVTVILVMLSLSKHGHPE
jgi:hypothetical protein